MKRKHTAKIQATTVNLKYFYISIYLNRSVVSKYAMVSVLLDTCGRIVTTWSALQVVSSLRWYLEFHESGEPLDHGKYMTQHIVISIKKYFELTFEILQVSSVVQTEPRMKKKPSLCRRHSSFISNVLPTAYTFCRQIRPCIVATDSNWVVLCRRRLLNKNCIDIS